MIIFISFLKVISSSILNLFKIKIKSREKFYKAEKKEFDSTKDILHLAKKQLYIAK